jgi:molybdate transport system substrate-binding protein
VLPAFALLRALPVLLALSVMLTLPSTDATAAEPPLRVAVAANFRATAEALSELHQRAGAGEITLSSASTGVLAAQLRSGAPFDLLLAADAQRPAALHREGFGAGEPLCYAVGQLVLLGADDIERALAMPGQRIAIANPATAPYGAAAESVLARPDFAAAGHRLLRGANVLQAYQYHVSGAAQLALVARSLSPDSGLLIPAHWHPPIAQHALVSARGRQPERARAFLDFIRSDAARPLLAERGYLPCS